MTTHIWKDKVHHPPTNKTHWAHRMLCGQLLPRSTTALRTGVNKSKGDQYVTKEMVLKNLRDGFGGGSWTDECPKCFNDPEIQLLTLAHADLGEY